MSKNIIVISCELRETRVALIEDGIIAELHIERKGSPRTKGTVGDIVLGKVTRVLPGLQAAFIDIGLERAAFLHVEDLIRADDFEGYLAGGRKVLRDDEDAESAEAEAEGEAGTVASEPPVAAAPDAGAPALEEGSRRARGGRRSRGRRPGGVPAEDASAEAPRAGDEARGWEAPAHAGPASDTPLEGPAADEALSLPELRSVPRLAAADEADGDEPPSLPSGRTLRERTRVEHSSYDLTVSDPDLAAALTDDEEEEWDAVRAPSVERPSVGEASFTVKDGTQRMGLPSADDGPLAVAAGDDFEAEEPLSDDDILVDDEDQDENEDLDDDLDEEDVDDEDDDEDADEEDDLDDADQDDDEDEDHAGDLGEDDELAPRDPSDEGVASAGGSAAQGGWADADRAAPGHDVRAEAPRDRAPRDQALGERSRGGREGGRSQDRGRGATGTRGEGARGRGPSAGYGMPEPELPGFTITELGEPMPRAPAPRLADDDRRGRRRGRRGRGRGRGGDERNGSAHGRGGDGGGDRRRREGGEASRERSDRQSMLPGRLSKSTPIREVVKEGQEIIVQITKEPIGTKGARCSSHISLPGRYVVYLPTVEHVGVSKRIGNDRERARLKEAIHAIKPPTGGLIVRTLAEGLTKKQLKQDVGYLVRLWADIAQKRTENPKAPAMLYSELDIVLKTARDLFTDDVEKIVIDDRREYERLVRFVDMFMPDRRKDVVLYTGDEPIFDGYGIEDEIGRALGRKVPLPSGGYLIIDQAEALTAIDVNTGRFVGKGSKDMEETILKTNLEAAQEIAYQLRFRNIGGLIILDFIDMEKATSREKVRRRLEELLQKDKAKTTLNRISELGLIEMTRKRTRESLGRLLHEPCFYCDGTGQLQSKETVAYEILREIRRKRQDLPGYTVLVNAHPAVADVLTGEEREAVAEAENRYMRKITVVPRPEYHYEQFDLQGK
jgi:ribonuclease G